MKSFKLDKSPRTNQQIEQAGVFLIILGIVTALIFSIGFGLIMVLIGVVMNLAGANAS